MQLLPQFIYPEIYIMAGMPGASPDKVEKDVVIPVEGELSTLDGVHDIESTVNSERAVLKVSFDYGTNMRFALLKLNQKIALLQERLPATATVRSEQFDTADLGSYLMNLSIRSKAGIDAIREVAERRVRERLEQVDGVVNVSVGGGDQQTIGVVVDPARCEAMSIPMERVGQRINAFHRQPEHLGRVLTSGKYVDVIMDSRMTSPDELADLIIEPGGPIRVRDVAAVGFVADERTQLYRVNGTAGVGLFVQKDNTSNMLKVNKDVLREIDALNEELAPEGYEIVVTFSQAELIQDAIDRLQSLALTGGLLAMIVLYLFLRNLRFVSILMIAIPVSLLITFNFMYAFDLSINVLSMCGLALAVGMLVDNGIVVMENIFLRRQAGNSAAEAARIGTKEVGRSIMAATVTTILVFAPVLFIETRARLLVKELSLSVIFPLAISLLAALTVIPLLARRALSGQNVITARDNRIREIYRLLLKSAIRHRARAFAWTASLLVISLLVASGFILTEAPPPPPARLDIYLTMPDGFTLDASDEIAQRLETQAQALSDVDEVHTSVREGQAHIQVFFKKPDERTEELELEKVKQRVRRQNERLERVDLAFAPPNTGGQTPANSNDGLGGLLRQEEGLKIKGQDLEKLRQLSGYIVETLQTIPGIEDRSVQTDLRSGPPELQIRGDRLSLAVAGLSMQNIMAAIWASRVEGSRTSTPMPNPGGDVDIQLLSYGADERQLDDIEQLKIPNNAGQLVPLKQVARIRTNEGNGNIIRHNQERQVKVTYEFNEETQLIKNKLEQAKAQIAAMMQALRLPKGFTAEKLEPEEDQSVYYWMLAIGVGLIYMFLAAQFESLLTPVVILGTVPTAIIGALLALLLSDTPLSLGAGAPMALLGLIVLLGIVVNNGIILLDRISVLQNTCGFRWQRAVLVAGQSRVRPIIMTSVTTCLGLLPLSLKQGTELELWPPFAITVLGGLLFSAFATLIFVPVLYVGLQQTKAWFKRIGIAGVILGTSAATALVVWHYRSYESVLWTCIVALPVWFALLGVVSGIRQFFLVHEEKQRLSGKQLTIQISNLTKIYGAPGRFMRQWQKQERRMARIAERGGEIWDRAGLHERAVWLAAGGALLLYLHFFFEGAFWLLVVSACSPAWIYAVVRWWERRQALATVEVDARKQKRVRGIANIALLLLFLFYIQIRIASIALTLSVAAVILVIVWLNRISTRIATGVINPQEPQGRFRRSKRAIYTLTQKIPAIRPPRKQVVALHGVDLKIGKGMFGLLGPNGAGKTTLMRILVGVLQENRGSVRINGLKLSQHRETFHGSIGYLPQDFGLYENMTPVEYLNYHALLSGLYETKSRRQLIDELIESVGLGEKRNTKISSFSGGMKQRVGIAHTLLHLPQIIVVDEPTVGLDPKERIRFRNLLSELAKDRIIVFSTHIVEDVSSTCDDLAVLNKGRVIYRGSPREMEQLAAGKIYEAIVPEEEFNNWQKELHVIQHAKADDGIRMRFLSHTPAAPLPARSVAPTLEDAYVYLLDES